MFCQDCYQDPTGSWVNHRGILSVKGAIENDTEIFELLIFR